MHIHCIFSSLYDEVKRNKEDLSYDSYWDISSRRVLTIVETRTFPVRVPYSQIKVHSAFPLSSLYGTVNIIPGVPHR
jgi:hypothetical protein